MAAAPAFCTSFLKGNKYYVIMEKGMFLCFFIEFDLGPFYVVDFFEGCVISLLTENALRKLGISDTVLC